MVGPDPYALKVAHTLESRIRAERVRVLYDVSPVSFFTQIVVVALIAFALSGQVDATVLGVWAIYMIALSLVRIAIYLRYRNNPPLAIEARRWEAWFAVGAAGIGLGWGALCVATFPIESIAHEMLLVATVASMAIGGLAALQGSPLAFACFSGPPLALLALTLAMRGDTLHTVTSGLVLLLFVTVGLLFLRLNRALVVSYHARFENESLAEELDEAQERLRASVEEQQLVFDTAMVGICITRGRRIERCNRRMEKMLGYRRGGLTSASTRALYANDEAWQRFDRAALDNFKASGFHEQELHLVTRDGAAITVHARGQAIDRHDLGRGVIWVVEDITARKEADAVIERASAAAAAANERLTDAIETIPDAFALFDREDRLVLCNRAYMLAFTNAVRTEEIVGRTFEELLRVSIAMGEVIPPTFQGDVEAWVAERLHHHRNPGAEGFVYQLGDGRWLQAKERRTRDGGIVGVRSDITALKASEEQVRHLANHDPLTGLPNRRLLQDRLMQACGMARRTQAQVAVMLVDLDDFKSVNDRHGHKVGDRVLQVVSGRLRGGVRQADTVARQGGDEFVIVLPELRSTVDAVRVAEKLLAAIARPIEIDSLSFDVRASIGIAMFPADGDDSDPLLKGADIAMYRAKQAGRHRYEFYSAAVAKPAA